MKNQFLPLLAASLFFSFASFAQSGKKDVVYLKNGSIVRGVIISQQPDGPTKIKTGDNSIWVFEPNAIDSITQKSKSSLPFGSGYFNLTEGGVLVGNSDNAYDAPFTFMNISGWQFANGFTAGIGAGVEFFNETYIPVVADFRYYLRKQGIKPFVALQGGYGIALGKADKQYIYQYYPYDRPTIWPGPSAGEPLKVDARGGWLLNPSFGMSVPVNETLAITFGAGYRLMRHRYTREDHYKFDIDYNRLSLKIGVMFK